MIHVEFDEYLQRMWFFELIATKVEI